MQIDYSVDDMAEAIETVLQALDNSIPKQVIEEKDAEVREKRSRIFFKTHLSKADKIREDCELLGKQRAYKELLKHNQVTIK